ncbi:hypothetical protein AYL99_07633 [Fonsecaea erecta]|uniref:Cyclase n=1 Tax=Fonsecaea erecta TaxID=1367422 RepID=A0A178ZH88_9EURO|nr:hypothetical protein AYL99_07633 [Fonsecaea erecta]OAP58543.1 hypothetical protein AYL99_07633 [Fonsecaea erecta]
MSDLKLPSWKDLPPVEGMPHGCAWGLFDKDGVRDEIGTLNLLTPETVVKAREEIQSGKSVVLNWPIDHVHEPGFDRIKPTINITDWRAKGSPWYSYDDEISINTQSGSQWDGLRHWGHSGTGLYYNRIHHDELLKTDRIGIDHWSKRGGIVGRGVLLDYVAYAARHNIAYDAMTRHRITLDVLKDIAKEENVDIHPGDILLVRSGWIKWYNEHSPEERVAKVKNGSEYVGVDGSEEVVQWIWNSHFAAVGGDAIGFEAWPPQLPWCLHDFVLALWGMPLGELWDLEALAAECESQQRWSFFITSAPLNTPGGIASPPNAIAVF